MKYGAAPTHTPPKPTSKPLTRFSFSANTLRLSKRPSPSASSKMRMRSRPSRPSARNRIFVRFGNPHAAAIVERHRDRLLHVGLRRGDGHAEAVGQLHLAGRFVGRQTGMRIIVGVARRRVAAVTAGTRGGSS